MKLCANLSLLFTEVPLLERIAIAARAGFAGVEIQFPYEVSSYDLRRALKAADMPLALINLPAADLMQGGPGLAAVPSRQAEFDAAVAQTLVYAASLRPAAINVLPGRLADGVSREEALATLAANLRRAAEAFEPLGIRVTAEAINPHDMPGFLINTAEDLYALQQAVRHPNFGVQLDIYHMARQGLDLVECIALLAGHIGHVQFADCPGRGAPGTGDVDFASAMQALRASGYSGWIGAEYRPRDGDQDGELRGWLSRWRECQLHDFVMSEF